MWNGYELFYLRAIYYALKKKEKKKSHAIKEKICHFKKNKAAGKSEKATPSEGN